MGGEATLSAPAAAAPTLAARWARRALLLVLGSVFVLAIIAAAAQRADAAVTCNEITNAGDSQTLSQAPAAELVSVTVDDTAGSGAQSVAITNDGFDLEVNGSFCGSVSGLSEIDVAAAPGSSKPETTSINLTNSDLSANPTSIYIDPTSTVGNTVSILNGTNVILGTVTASAFCPVGPCSAAVLGNEQTPAEVHMLNVSSILASGATTGDDVLSAAGQLIPAAADAGGFSLSASSGAASIFTGPFSAATTAVALCGGTAASNLFVPGATTETVNACAGGTATNNTLDVSLAGGQANVDLSSGIAVIGAGANAITDPMTDVQNVNGSNHGGSITGNGSASILTGGTAATTFVVKGGNDTLVGKGSAAANSVTFADPSNSSPVTVNLTTQKWSASGPALGISGIATVTGTLSGGDVFTPLLPLGTASTSTYANPASSLNTLNVALAASGCTVNLSLTPEAFGCASSSITDTVTNIQNVVGSNQGMTIIGNTAPSTLTGGNAGLTTFVLAGGNDTIVGSPTASGALSFRNDAASAVNVDLSTGAYSGFGSGTMSNIQTIDGSSHGGDIYTPNFTAGGVTLNGKAVPGFPNQVNLGSAPCAATVDLSVATAETIAGCGNEDFLANVANVVGATNPADATTVSFQEAGTINVNLNLGTYGGSVSGALSGITNIVGPASGPGPNTFTPNFTTGGDSFTGHAGVATTVNLSAGACPASIDLSISPETVSGCGSTDLLTGVYDVIGVPGGADATTVTFSHAESGATINLSSGTYTDTPTTGVPVSGTLTGITRVVGSPTGGDTFTPNFSLGGDTFTGTGQNTVNLNQAGENCTIDVTLSPEQITGCGATPDLVTGLQNVVGTSTTTIAFANAPGPVEINLSTATVAVANLATPITADSYRFGNGSSFSVVGVQNVVGSSLGDTIVGNSLASTFTGGAGTTTFVVMGGADTIKGAASFPNVVDYSESTANNGVHVNLSTGSVSGPFGGHLTNVTTVLGSPGGGDTFTPAFTGLQDSYTGSTTGAANTIDVSGSGCATTVVDLRPETAVPTAAATASCSSPAETFATFSGIQNVLGSNFGGTIFANGVTSTLNGGTAATTFVLAANPVADTIVGAPNVVNTLNIQAAQCPVTVGLAGGTLVCGASPAGTISNVANVIGIASGADRSTVSFSGAAGGVTVNFQTGTYTNGLSSGALTSVTRVIGSTTGGDDVLLSLGGGDTYAGAATAVANILDVSSLACPANVNLSFLATETVTGCGSPDTLSGFQDVNGIVGPTNKTTVTFLGANAGVTVSFDTGAYTNGAVSGTLTGVDTVIGSHTGGDTVVPGSGGGDTYTGTTVAAHPNTIDVSSLDCTAVIGLAGSPGTITGCGGADAFTGFVNVVGVASGADETQVALPGGTTVTLTATSPTFAYSFSTAHSSVSGTLSSVANLAAAGTGNTLDVSIASCPASIDFSGTPETVDGCSPSPVSLTGFQNIRGNTTAADLTTVTLPNPVTLVVTATGFNYTGSPSGTLTGVTTINTSGISGDTIDVSGLSCAASVTFTATTQTLADCATTATLTGFQNVKGIAAAPHQTSVFLPNGTSVVLTGAGTGFTYTDASQAGTLTSVKQVSASTGIAANSLDVSGASCSATVDLSALAEESVTNCGTEEFLAGFTDLTGNASQPDQTVVSFHSATGGVNVDLGSGSYTNPTAGGFSGVLTGISKIVGSPTGGDTIALASGGGDTYTGTAGLANTVNVSTLNCAAVVNFSLNPETVTGCGASDSLTNVEDVQGISLAPYQTAVVLPSATTLVLGGAGFTYTGPLTGTLTAVTIVTASGTGNTLDVSGVACPASVNLATAPETLTGCGNPDTLTGFQNLAGLPTGVDQTQVVLANPVTVMLNATGFTYSGSQSGTLTGITAISTAGTSGNTIDVSTLATCAATVSLSGTPETIAGSGCGNPDTLSGFQNVKGIATGAHQTAVALPNGSDMALGSAGSGFTYSSSTRSGTLTSVSDVTATLGTFTNALDVSGASCKASIDMSDLTAETLSGCGGTVDLLSGVQNVTGIATNADRTVVSFSSAGVGVTVNFSTGAYTNGSTIGVLSSITDAIGTALGGDSVVLSPAGGDTYGANPGVALNNLDVSNLAGCSGVVVNLSAAAQSVTNCGSPDSLTGFENVTGISSGTAETAVTLANLSTIFLNSTGFTYTEPTQSGTLTAISVVNALGSSGNAVDVSGAGCPAVVDLSSTPETITGCGTEDLISGFQNVTGTATTALLLPNGSTLVVTAAGTGFTYSNATRSGLFAGVSKITAAGSSGNTLNVAGAHCLAVVDMSKISAETLSGCGSQTDQLAGFNNLIGVAGGVTQTAVTFVNAGQGVTVNLGSGAYANGSVAGILTNIVTLTGSATGGDAITPGVAGGDSYTGFAVAGNHNTVNVSTLGCPATIDITSATETVTGCGAPDTLTNVQNVAGINLGSDQTTVTFATAPSGVSINLAVGTYAYRLPSTAEATGMLSGVNHVVGSAGGGDTVVASLPTVTNPDPTDSYAGTPGVASNTIDLSTAGGPATINFNLTTATVTIAAAGGTTTVNLTNVQVALGTTHGDVFTPAYSAVADRYVGTPGAGTNVLDLSAAPAGGTSINLATGSVTGGGWSGADTVSGITSVRGSAFNDDLIPGPGNIAFNGNAGSNTIDFSTAPAGATINLSTGTTSGGWGGTDTLANVANAIGSAFDDTLVGGSAPGILEGLAGNDTLIPTGAYTVLDGGVGTNTLALNTAPVGINVDLSDPSPQSAGGYGSIEIVGDSIQVLDGPNAPSVLAAGAGTDILNAGSSGGNLLLGGLGTDILNAGSGGDTLWAGTASDTLNGGAGNDLLVAGAGNDTFSGAGGNNTLDFAFAPAGANINVSGGFFTAPNGAILPANSVSGAWGSTDSLSNITNVIGTPFNDIIVVGTNATANGNQGSDFLYGSGGNDTLISGSGNSTFEATSGNNLIEGGPGNNTVTYANDPAGVNVNLGTGVATNGYGGVDTISGVRNIVGSNFADVLRLGALSGTISSGGGNDLLVGSTSGGDTLTAGSGNDTLEASGTGAQPDTLVAGTGVDIFFTRNGHMDTLLNVLSDDQAQIDPGVDILSAPLTLLP